MVEARQKFFNRDTLRNFNKEVKDNNKKMFLIQKWHRQSKSSMGDHRTELNNIQNLIDTDDRPSNDGGWFNVANFIIIEILSHKPYFKDLKALKQEMQIGSSKLHITL